MMIYLNDWMCCSCNILVAAVWTTDKIVDTARARFPLLLILRSPEIIVRCASIAASLSNVLQANDWSVAPIRNLEEYLAVAAIVSLPPSAFFFVTDRSYWSVISLQYIKEWCSNRSPSYNYFWAAKYQKKWETWSCSVNDFICCPYSCH